MKIRLSKLQRYILIAARTNFITKKRDTNRLVVGASDITSHDVITGYYGTSSMSAHAAVSRAFRRLVDRGLLAHSFDYRLRPISGKYLITSTGLTAAVNLDSSSSNG